FGAIAIAAAAILWAWWREPPTASRAGGGSETSAAGSWVGDPAASEIAFWGVHAGAAFRGHFRKWQADIRFDPADPEHSTIDAIVDTASAVDGVPLHEETLPQPEWFDVAKY